MIVNESVSDIELVANLKKGDIEAFDQIFKRYGNKLFRFALKYLKSKEEAEGLVQDVFLKIWENRKSLKKESSLKSYLFTITYHKICRVFKKRQIFLKYIGEASQSDNQINNTEEKIQYESILKQIDLLIDKLPGKQKIAFIKSRKEGKTSREIAEELKLAPGTVDNYISAALNFLKNHLSTGNLAIILFFNLFLK